MDCVLTVNPPKKRMGKRMKLLQEQQEAETPSSTVATQSALPATNRNNETQVPPPLSANPSSDGFSMSPGLSSLLQAVAQEGLSNFTSTGSYTQSDRQANGSGSGNGMAAHVEEAPLHVPIIQNGMFAAFEM